MACLLTVKRKISQSLTQMRSNRFLLIKLSLPLFILIAFSNFLFAQQPGDTAVPVRIAVVSPVYLDSAYDNSGSYKYSNINMPRFILPGLEFYNGVAAALDTLQQRGVNLEVWIYDSKKTNQTTQSLLAEMIPHHFSMVIASFSNPAEQKAFSDYSLNYNVPIISATYPNDAFVNGNPFFILLNSTLKTHVNAIQDYVERYKGNYNWLWVTKEGNLENTIRTMYIRAGANQNAKFKTVKLNSQFDRSELIPFLDSTRKNMIVFGSVDENFGSRFIKLMDKETSYQTTVFGMPTWDGMKAVTSTENPALEIVYTTPFNYTTVQRDLVNLTESYKAKFNAKPSDMFYKGYESMYRFGQLLNKYRYNILNHLQDTSFRIANKFNLAPVFPADNKGIPDYIENKELHFIHVISGNVVRID